VAIYSLIPLVVLICLGITFAWAAFGKTVEGRFTYYLNVGPTGQPQDQMQVEYAYAGEPQALAVGGLGHNELHMLGMLDQVQVVQGKPLVDAKVPVRVLQIGRERYAVAIFPWTSVWKRMILPLILAVIAVAGLGILHGDMFEVICRSYGLVKRGEITAGRQLGTHETGWWEPSGEYSWTYIRRCYVDYVFVGPDRIEHRGCQLVLGAMDPALLAEGRQVAVLYDQADFNRHVMYEACGFRVRAG
jgi:hypothetical protein